MPSLDYLETEILATILQIVSPRAFPARFFDITYQGKSQDCFVRC